MFHRQKKLTLNTPYSKITKNLWDTKSINTVKQKENLILKTKLHHIKHNKHMRDPESFNIKRLEEKYKKLIDKQKDQSKWIKCTNDMIEERKYQELMAEITKIQQKLKATTTKAIKYEQKVKSHCSKIKIVDNFNIKSLNKDQKIQNNRISELQKQKAQMMILLKHKQQRSLQIQEQNKKLNREIIELLIIKNKLRNDQKEARQNDYQLKQSCCKIIEKDPTKS